MSESSTPSRVAEYLAGNEDALQQVLDALRVSTGQRGAREGVNISCPWPGHEDSNPSCTVRASQGLLHCQAGWCGAGGDGTILMPDLVVALGRAGDRAEAMRWLEDVLRLPASSGGGVPRTVCDDPSLTVSQYLALKELPASIADAFALEDVQAWMAPSTKHGEVFEAGYYTCVLMPARASRRPRARSAQPTRKVWAPRKWRTLDRETGVVADARIDADSALDAYGAAQLAPCDALPGVLLVVEGESDVHAAHAMGVTCVLGTPGASGARGIAADVIEAATRIEAHTIVVGREPGRAGERFPQHVMNAVLEAADGSVPRFASLAWSRLPGEPGDLADLWIAARSDAASLLVGAVMELVGSPAASTRPAELATGADELPAAPAPAHAPLPTADAARGPDAPALASSADDLLRAAHDPGLASLPDDMVRAAEPSAASGRPMLGDADPWAGLLVLDDAPVEEDLPLLAVEGLEARFERARFGWVEVSTTAKGEVKRDAICSHVHLASVDRCEGELLATFAAPVAGAWKTVRMPLSDASEAPRLIPALATIGVLFRNRKRSSGCDLVGILIRKYVDEVALGELPKGTGWVGPAASGVFAGVNAEPVDLLPRKMFEANEARRGRVDTQVAANRWYEALVEPLMSRAPAEPLARHAAPILALGTAAAATLVAPLASERVNVSPVCWLHGLGGGGKSTLQVAAASIFAPTPGQAAFSANANMSLAALNARATTCRDLPLVLDDVTQLPPAPGSTSRGDAARIEAAAALAMLVFNRRPIERATRDGQIRLTHALRSTAVFSAEIGPSSEAARASITAGQRRRIQAVESTLLADYGIGKEYAERVYHESDRHGGAAGELLIAHVAALSAARSLRDRFDAAHALLDEPGVETTQRESLAMTMTGWGLLVEAIGAASYEEALEAAAPLLMAWLRGDDVEGAERSGALRESELSGVDRALEAVRQLTAANHHRIHDHRIVEELGGVGQLSLSQETLGRVVEGRDGRRRVVLLRSAMRMLESQYGVSSSVVEAAIAEGSCERGYRVRIGTQRVRGYAWLLDDDDPEHDHDPHGLLEPAPAAPEPDRLAPGPAASEPAATMRSDEEDDVARFQYESGTYEADPEQDRSAALEQVVAEAREELDALAELFAGRVQVAPVPPDDDERWAKLEALGAERARSLKVNAEAALSSAQSAPADQRAGFDEQYVRAYRLLLLARIRRPEWFIEEATDGE